MSCPSIVTITSNFKDVAVQLLNVSEPIVPTVLPTDTVAPRLTVPLMAESRQVIGTP